MEIQDLQNLIIKSKKFGTDFHGTLDSGKFIPPENTILITGTLPEDTNKVEEDLKNLGFKNRISEIIYNENNDISPIKVGEFKARKIKELGIDLYFDDDPEQIFWIKKFNPNANVVYINALNYAIFTFYGEGIGYAIRLKEEGNNVVVGFISPERVGKKVDDEVLEERRKQLGKGLVKTTDAELLYNFLIKNKNRKDYFIDFDFDLGSYYAEKLMNIDGEKYDGFFFTEEDRQMEEDRQKAQNFVRENYKDVAIAFEKEFNNIKDALEFLQDNQDDFFVIKANEDVVNTLVPNTEDWEQFYKEVEGFLNKNKAILEKSGFILQKKIQKPVEATPEAMYYKGKPVAFTCDLETKKIGSGDIGYTVGCAYDFVFPLKEEDKLVQVGLKPYFPFAKKKTLSNFMDASLLIDRKTDIPYFGEFCPRKGYNCFYTELSLLPSVSHYFELIKQGKNPFTEKLHPYETKIFPYGASIRLFNLLTDKNRYIKSDIPIVIKTEYSKNVWLWDIKKDSSDNNEIKTVGYDEAPIIITGQGDSPEEAIQNCIDNLKQGVNFESMYWRNDILEKDSWYSILNRFYYLEKNKWFN